MNDLPLGLSSSCPRLADAGVEHRGRVPCVLEVASAHHRSLRRRRALSQDIGGSIVHATRSQELLDIHLLREAFGLGGGRWSCIAAVSPGTSSLGMMMSFWWCRRLHLLDPRYEHRGWIASLVQVSSLQDGDLYGFRARLQHCQGALINAIATAVVFDLGFEVLRALHHWRRKWFNCRLRRRWCCSATVAGVDLLLRSPDRRHQR
mmetsp:Transcript_36016/g.84450  ORF Transcript_36016/g.84450 Transcript_36016/m.84450 type:complete len:205 (+) Transcript_36016:1348-1962(+)